MNDQPRKKPSSGGEGQDEDSVADFTVAPEEGTVRLRSAIDVEKLINRQGVYLDPEVEIDNMKMAEMQRNYYVGADAEIASVMNTQYEDEDGSSDDADNEFSPFEKKIFKMIPLTPDGGVKKRIISTGLETDGAVPDRATVTIHYALFLEAQDEPYDSTYLRSKSERYRLDDGQLLPGLEIAIKSMKNKEKAEFIIEPNYAFGSMGCPPRVPGDAQVLAKVELLSFVQEGKVDAILAMPPELRNKELGYQEIQKVVSREHVEGNKYVEKQEYKLAVRKYERGCKLLEEAEIPDDQAQKEQERLLMKLRLNRALCYLKIPWPKKACLVLQEALKMDKNNVKALYRMGKAKRMIGNVDAFREAHSFLTRALRIDPGNEAVGRELADLDAQIKREQDEERAVCRRMFGNVAPNRSQNSTVFSSNDASRISTSSRPVDDDVYEDISEQLNSFKLDETQSELLLPAGFDNDTLNVVCRVAAKLGLAVAPGKVDGQWKVSKSGSFGSR